MRQRIITLFIFAVLYKTVTSCGNPKTKPITGYRVVGGEVAVPHSWPWQVSLMSALKTPLCGGSIIAPQWILSAAHCYFLNDYMPKPAIVRVGEHDLTPSVVEPNQQDFEIVKKIFHPEYDDDAINNDMVLLKLDRPITYNNDVQPICLPAPNEAPSHGEICYVTGWGDTLLENRKKRDASVVLRQVALPIISPSACKNIKAVKNDLTDFMMCAGFPNGGKDSCQGDSGGPLVCESKENKWVQQGIVSWGYHCAAPDSPGLYTRVSKYMEWIASTMANN